MVVHYVDRTFDVWFHFLLPLLIYKCVDCQLRISSSSTIIKINEIEVEKTGKLELTCVNSGQGSFNYTWYKRPNKRTEWKQFAWNNQLIEVNAEPQYYYCEAITVLNNSTMRYSTQQEPVFVKVNVDSDTSGNGAYIAIMTVCIIIALALAVVLFFIYWRRRKSSTVGFSKDVKNKDTSDTVPVDDDGYIVPVRDSSRSHTDGQLARDSEYIEVDHPSSRPFGGDPLYENLPTARKNRR